MVQKQNYLLLQISSLDVRTIVVTEINTQFPCFASVSSQIYMFISLLVALP